MTPPTAAPLPQRGSFEHAEAVDPRYPFLIVVDEDWGESGVPGNVVDPLLGLAEVHPEAAVSFLRAVLLLGLATGSLLPMPCVAFLASAWEPCGECSQPPLRLWVLVRCGVYLLQAMVFLQLYVKLGRSPDMQGVQQVISSCAWKGCQSLSTAGHAWLVVGVVWLINSDFQGPCRGLMGVVFGLMVAALVKPILTVVAFRRIVPAHLQSAGRATAGAHRGACEEVIRSLPLVHFVSGDGRETSCAVCLGDFDEGESLRQLPCCHKFHAPCVDKWLAKNSRCPLCIAEVGGASPSGATPRAASEC